MYVKREKRNIGDWKRVRQPCQSYVETQTKHTVEGPVLAYSNSNQ